MMNILFDSLKAVAKPFIGTGIIQKTLPGLIPVYENLYSNLRRKAKGNVIKLSNGYKMKGPDIGGSSVLLSLDLTGAYDPLMTSKLLESLEKQKVFVDIGANVGYFTMLASQKVGIFGEVYAFEPLNANVQSLYENVISNDCRNVHVLNYAIGNSDEDIFVEADYADTGRSKVSKKAGNTTRTVQQHKLDTLYYQGMLPVANVIKIDVRGYEPLVFEGGKQYFAKCGRGTKCFVEINDNTLKKMGFGWYSLVTTLESVGFTITQIMSEADRTVQDYTKDLLKTYIEKHRSVNVICEYTGNK